MHFLINNCYKKRMFLKLYNIINHASLGLSSLNKPEANGLLLSCIFTVDRTVRRREA